jgi:hypothetical protein
MWIQAKSRTHTAYGRLTSLLGLTDGEDPIKLAELGLINEDQKYKRFVHFQEPHVPLESIYQNSNLISTLEKQLPANYHLKGLSTWNVKLDKTLNALPPCEHLNGLSKQIYAKENITTHSTVDEIHCVGNFVMTANHENASINIFSTQMGLNRTLQHNFYKQRH